MTVAPMSNTTLLAHGAVAPGAALRRLRVIAGIEAVGALLGTYAFVGTWVASFELNELFPVSLFVFVVVQAYRVWHGDRRATERLSWVLAAQIPWLNLQTVNLHYHLYLSLACFIRLGSAAEPLELGLGTSLDASFGAARDAAFVGVNLVALLLFGVTRLALRANREPRPS